MNNSFFQGEQVVILKGKFKNQTGVVVETATDSGITRVRVKIGDNVFSYLANNLQSAQTTAAVVGQ